MFRECVFHCVSCQQKGTCRGQSFFLTHLCSFPTSCSATDPFQVPFFSSSFHTQLQRQWQDVTIPQPVSKAQRLLHWVVGVEISGEGLVWLFCLDVNAIPLDGGTSILYSSRKMKLLPQFLSLYSEVLSSSFSWDVSSIAPGSHLCRYKPVLTTGPHSGPKSQVPYLTWRRASVPDHVDFGNQFPWHTDASMLAPQNMAIGETWTRKF